MEVCKTSVVQTLNATHLHHKQRFRPESREPLAHQSGRWLIKRLLRAKPPATRRYDALLLVTISMILMMNTLNKHFSGEASLQSPWLNQRLESLLNTEFEYCEELQNDPTLTVNQAINWIYQNGGEMKLRALLKELAQPFAVDHRWAETWVSPPPSGAGNTVVVVSGFDASDEMRMVGSNWCNRPGIFNTGLNFQTFFQQFDNCADNAARTDLLQDALDACVQIHGKKWVEEVHKWCRIFRTMPIHVIALTVNGPLIATFPAVVHGVRFCDLSLEKVGGA